MTWRVVLLLAWCLGAAAQTGSISGVVVDQAGSPLRKAVLNLAVVDGDASAVEISDSDGRFAFTGLPARKYTLYVERDGYRIASAFPMIALQPGESRSLVVRMIATGSVSGTILDDVGEPVVAADVRLLRRVIVRGKPTFQSEHGAVTDDRGRYRIYGVKPGAYFVGARSNTMVPEVEGQRAIVHEVQFWRSTDHISGAAPLLLGPGSELTGVDFRLRVANTGEVRGRVTGVPEDSPGLNVSLHTLDLPSVVSHAFAFTLNRDGSFVYKNVVPGRYLLSAHHASGQTYRSGRTPVTVAGGVTISADVALEAPVSLAGSVAGDVPLKGVRVRFVYADSVQGVLGWSDVLANVGADGSFRADRLASGTWDVTVDNLPAGAYVKSMMLGEEDVLRQDMVVGPKTKAPLRIVVSSKGATIEGTTDGDGVVLVAPDGELASNLGFYYLVAASAARFTLEGVRPGSYRVYAFDELDGSEWQEAGFLKPFTGMAVTVAEGDAVKLKLPLVKRSPR